MRINNVPNYCLVIPAAVLTAVLLLGWYFVQPIPFPALERCERVEVAYAQLSPSLVEQDSDTLLPTSAQWEEVEEFLVGKEIWLDTAICLVLMIMVEPILLSRWGTTPGKAIFGLRVEKADGGRLTYGEGNTRTMSMIWRGLGWNVPIYTLVRLIKSYNFYCREKELPWDRALDLVVEARPKSSLRNGAFAAAAAAVLGLTVLTIFAGGFPPNRGSLTPAELAENYNFLAEY